MMQISFVFLCAICTTLVIASNPFASKPYPQEALDNYNVLRYLANIGPYISSPGHGIPRTPPSTCNVTQAHVVARHGERYPAKSKGEQLANALQRLRNITDEISGPLSFLSTYEYPALDEERYETESSEGAYAGLANAYRFGSEYRDIYNDLVPENETDLKFFASSQERVVITAQNFARGFLGHEIDSNKTVVSINETDPSYGANSLTPRVSCKTYNESINNAIVKNFSTQYLDDIADRLNRQSPELEINSTEVAALLDYVPYDLNVHASTKISDIFELPDFIHRGYYDDLGNYWNQGPGNNVTNVIGAPFIEALIKLLSSDDIPLSFSFTHETDMYHIYSTIGLFDSSLPSEYIDFNAVWKTASITPMGARLTFERLECESEDSPFLRIIVNDAVIPIPGLQNGPGFSASLDDFENHISERLNGKSYGEDCEIEAGVPTNLTFFWDN